MQFDPNDPKTVGYTASVGEVAVTRTRAQIVSHLMDFKGENAIFDDLEDGVMVAGVMERSNTDNSPSIIDYWDEKGRLVHTHFVGSRGGFANGFTNHYQFDDKGRLVRFWQVAHREDGDFAWLDQRYEYIDGRPDRHYTSYTSYKEGDFVTETYEQRLFADWGRQV